MTVYRMVRSDRIAPDGKGAAEYPGRWNKQDIPCVYTSSSPSLAQLEVMVNIDEWKIFLVVPYLILKIEVSEKKIHPILEKHLPLKWDAAVYSSKTQQLGSDLLGNPDIIAFTVPSTVSKTELNIVLNPRAVDFSRRVMVVEKILFEFDRRLLRESVGRNQ